MAEDDPEARNRVNAANHDPDISSAAKGTYRNPRKPSFSRNAFWNDYHGRRIYMYTFKMAKGFPPLSVIKGNPKVADTDQDPPRAEYTEIGYKVSEIVNGVLEKYPSVKTLRLLLMPDHIHLVIFVTERIEVHAGRIAGHLKTVCSSRLKKFASEPSRNLHGGKTGFTIFDGKPHHSILKGKGQLEKMLRYVDDNPRRHLIKSRNKDLFRIRRKVQIGEHVFATIGNMFLLRYPEIIPVRVRRSFSEDEYSSYLQDCLEKSGNGAVLVSPFISTKEKEIMRLAMQQGGRLIIIRKEGIPERYKPSGDFFDYCAEGKLLYLAPWEYDTCKTELTRHDCIKMNKIAEEIANLNKPCKILNHK